MIVSVKRVVDLQLIVVLTAHLTVINVINLEFAENVNMVMCLKIIDAIILIYCFSMISNILLVEVLICHQINGVNKQEFQ